MSFLKELGDSILETGTDIIDSIGDARSNETDLEAAKIERLKVNNAIAVEEAKSRADAKRKAVSIAANAVTVLLVLVSIYVLVAHILPNIKKLR